MIGAAAVALLGLGAASAGAATISQSRAVGPASFVGTINLKALAAGVRSGPPPQGSGIFASPKEKHAIPYRLYRNFAAHRPSAQEAWLRSPKARPAIMASSIDTAGSFNGLDHNDQRTLADNGNQFSLEPPDQALAVGNGFIVEAVNNAIQIYNHAGTALLSAPVAMNIFFNQVSEINRNYGNQRGPFLSDPRAFYDASTGHFFVSEWATLNDASGNPLYISVQFLAVSVTNDPTGNWYVYSYETTNANTPGCPCLPDFNMLGADANGVYISNNLFTIGGSEPFVGATIYALPKAALESGSNVTISQFAPMPNDFSIHPVISPPSGNFATEANGTEYAVEAVDDLTNNGLANSVNVWAISGTQTLTSSTPSLTLAMTPVTTETTNAVLPPANELDNPAARPLGGPSGYNDPVPLLNPDDGRFSAVQYYVNGQIYAAASTAVARHNPSHFKTGVATYVFNVSGGAPALSATVSAQSIISAPGDTHLIYPSLAVNASGVAAIGVTVSGKTYYPSAGVILSAPFGPPTINVSGPGAGPDDGFTAYPQQGGNGVGRWGDYGEGAVTEQGDFYIANEYIPNPNIYPRSTYANWGTFVTHVNP